MSAAMLYAGMLTMGALFAVPLMAIAALSFWTRWLALHTSTPKPGLWVAWLLVGGMGLLVASGAFGFVRSLLAQDSPGLAAKDRQRILAAGIAEAFYGDVIVLAVALVAALWVGGWTLARRRRP